MEDGGKVGEDVFGQAGVEVFGLRDFAADVSTSSSTVVGLLRMGDSDRGGGLEEEGSQRGDWYLQFPPG